MNEDDPRLSSLVDVQNVWSNPQVQVYGGIALLLTIFLGLETSLRSLISFPFAMNYWIIPGTLAVGIAVRKPFLFRIVPCLTVGVLVVALLSYQSNLSWPESLLLTIAVLGLFACTGRLEDAVCGSLQKVVSLKVAPAPTQHVALEDPDPSRTRHWGSFALIFAGWLLSVFLTARFSWAASDRRLFQEYRHFVSMEHGLVPWAHQGIQLVLVFAFCYAVAAGFLSYCRTRISSPLMGRLLLQHELWKWNGWEQRKIANSLKNRDDNSNKTRD